MHVPDEQHPFGQETLSQTQAPLTQRCPAAQAAFGPQVQLPLVQASALAPQFRHAPPAVPHDAVAALTQLSPASQQPFGHDVASQTHALERHRCPIAQTAPNPQAQAPLAHRSARAGSQEIHAEPSLPQAVAVGGLVHVDPEQHPLPQVTRLQLEHTPLTQMALPGQAVQVPPAVPHSEFVGLTHRVPEQHPVGQEVPSQTQLPPLQRCPVAQTPPVGPHTHCPLVVQRSVTVEPHGKHAAPPVPQFARVGGETHWLLMQHPDGHEVESQTHFPPAHRCPVPQGAWLPQTQSPAPEQVSAARGAQLTHDLPDVPHCPAVGGATQVDPAQQPLGQLVLSQTQVPLRQRCPTAQALAAPHRHFPSGAQ